MPEKESQSLTPEQCENARVGYQVATNLTIYEGNLIWSRFTAMVYANAIVVATLSLAMTTSTPKGFTAWRVALSFLGLVLCLVWGLLLRRGFQYFKYWISFTELAQAKLFVFMCSLS